MGQILRHGTGHATECSLWFGPAGEQALHPEPYDPIQSVRCVTQGHLCRVPILLCRETDYGQHVDVQDVNGESRKQRVLLGVEQLTLVRGEKGGAGWIEADRKGGISG